jgi:HrpA-like RNA helicase
MQPKPEAPRDKRSKRDTNSRSPSRYGPKRSHDGSSYSGSRSKCNPGNSSSSSAPRTLDLPEELRGAIVTRKENLLLVTGEPGSGKTTRVHVAVQRILGGHGVVIVPKRIMATASCWRLIKTGKCKYEDMGFAIGGSKKPGEKIMFVTAEWFINYFSEDPTLENAKFVILDEVHERDVVADIAMYIVRQRLASRERLTVILMSATLDSEGFIAYF